MRPDPKVREDYLKAFGEIVSRLAARLKGAPPASLPVRMYVAGGAALHLMTGMRVSEDIDAVFSRRIVLTDDIEVSYRDADGRARTLYLDRSYNDTLGLLHEDAYDDSRRVEIPGTDDRVIEVRALSPLDLAVTKISRFSDQDRADIEALAKAGLIDSRALRRRAEEALAHYVGDVDAVRSSIDIACRLIDTARPRKRR